VELVLYRALQECLTNIARHSNARRVRASLVYGDESVKLTVVDDGHGAPEEAEATGGGFGLPALEERVEALGGAFTAENAPGGGFAVEVELPFGHPFRSMREKP
jgi:signal transduction histidine kinase